MVAVGAMEAVSNPRGVAGKYRGVPASYLGSPWVVRREDSTEKNLKK